jgi:hypothetical protein
MTRRFLLQGLLLSLLSRVAAAVQQVTDGLRVGEQRPAWVAKDAAPGSTALSPAETENLLAFGDVIVEGRALSQTEHDYLAQHIQDSTSRIPGQLECYRRAAALLDRLAGKRFSGLSFVDRSQLIERYQLGARVISLGTDPVPSEPDARMIRGRIVPDLIRGYWSSPAGWAAVRYATFPGRCGDLTRYTRAEP